MAREELGQRWGVFFFPLVASSYEGSQNHHSPVTSSSVQHHCCGHDAVTENPAQTVITH